MNNLLYIIGILSGGVIWLFLKKQSAEVLLQNQEVKEKLLGQDKTKANNDALLQYEEELRKTLKEQAEKEKNNDVKPRDF